MNSVVEIDATSGAQSVVTSGGLLTITLGSAINSSFSSDLITSGTITITNLLDTGDEFLAVNTSGTNIVAVYNPATGVMTLTGDDTVANYEAVIRSATYNNTSQDPDTTNRVIEFLVNDGIDPNAPPAFTTLTIVAVNDQPAVSGLNATSITEAQSTTLTGTYTDVDQTDGHTLNIAWADPHAPDSSFIIGSISGLTALDTFTSARSKARASGSGC